MAVLIGVASPVNKLTTLAVVVLPARLAATPLVITSPPEPLFAGPGVCRAGGKPHLGLCLAQTHSCDSRRGRSVYWGNYSSQSAASAQKDTHTTRQYSLYALLKLLTHSPSELVSHYSTL